MTSTSREPIGAVGRASPRPPTARQQRVLDAIASLTLARGFPPTLRELTAHLGLRSTNGVSQHLAALRQRGLVTGSPRRSRTLQVATTCAADSRSLP